MGGIPYIMAPLKPKNNKAKASLVRSGPGNNAKGPRKSAAVATSNTMSTNRPRMRESAPGSRRVKHAEFISNVAGSVAFTANKVTLNPGIAATFPWLSTQAQGYEQYRFHSLRFEYVTRTSTSTVGSICLAPDYDADDLPPTTEVAVSSYMGAKESSAWTNSSIDLDATSMFPMGPRKYVRSYAVSGDLKVYDAGNLFYCTTGFVGTDDVGKLWVYYDCELFIPQTMGYYTMKTHSSLYARTGNQTVVTATPEQVDFNSTILDGLGVGDFATFELNLPRGKYFGICRVCVSNTAAESTAATLRALLNGGPIAHAEAKSYADIPANGTVEVVSVFIAESTGGDLLSIEITAQGASGTLTISSLRTTLSLQLA